MKPSDNCQLLRCDPYAFHLIALLVSSVVVAVTAYNKHLAKEIAKALSEEQDRRHQQEENAQLRESERQLNADRKWIAKRQAEQAAREAEGKRHADELIAASKAATDKEIADYEAIRYTENNYIRLLKTQFVISNDTLSPEQLNACLELFRKGSDADKRRLVEQREADIQGICEKNGEEYRAAELIRAKEH